MNQSNINPNLIFLFALFLTNCTNQSEIVNARQTSANQLKQEIVAAVATVDNQRTLETSVDEKRYVESIKNTKGLIVLSDKYGKNDFIRFYNEDGSLWYEFTYYYDDKDGEFEYANENFAPFAFHQDYFSLALKCVGEDKNRYEVIVNEETGLKKFVRKNDTALEFETWEEHILKTFSVVFDEKENSLRETPNGKLKEVERSKIDRFAAVEVKGDWLKVKWNTENNPNNDSRKTDFGWVKWKADEKLIIELFYFA